MCASSEYSNVFMGKVLLMCTHDINIRGEIRKKNQGPVVQSIVSLRSLLVVKMLTVLVSTISDSHLFLLKNVSSFCKCKSFSHFSSKNISVYAIFNDGSFNDTLTNDIFSFEKLGQVLFG